MVEDLLEGFFNRRALKKHTSMMKKKYNSNNIDHFEMRDMNATYKDRHSQEYDERMAKAEKLNDKLNDLNKKSGIINTIRKWNTYDKLEKEIDKANKHKRKMDQADTNIAHHQKAIDTIEKARLFANEFHKNP